MPRAVNAGGHRLIKAPLHRLWQMLSRLESHPRYAGLWYYADLIDRSQNSTVVELRGFFGGLPITSVQRFFLKPPGRIEFRQARGTLRDLTGAYVLREADGDTELEIQIAADAGIPLFSEPSVRQILAGHVESMLSKIKASAERDLVRLPARRPQAQAAAGVSPVPGNSADAAAGSLPAQDDMVEADEEERAGEDEAGREPAGHLSQDEAGGQPAGTAPSGAVPRQGTDRRRRRRRGRRRRPAGASANAPPGSTPTSPDRQGQSRQEE